jgi:hypothetical protein
MQLQKIADEIKNHQKKALELDMISKRYNKLHSKMLMKFKK